MFHVVENLWWGEWRLRQTRFQSLILVPFEYGKLFSDVLVVMLPKLLHRIKVKLFYYRLTSRNISHCAMSFAPPCGWNVSIVRFSKRIHVQVSLKIEGNDEMISFNDRKRIPQYLALPYSTKDKIETMKSERWAGRQRCSEMNKGKRAALLGESGNSSDKRVKVLQIFQQEKRLEAGSNGSQISENGVTVWIRSRKFK